MSAARAWSIAWLLCLFAVGAAGADEMELFQAQRLQGGAWRLRAEKIVYDAADRTYTAEGRVEVVQADRRLTADKVVINEGAKVASLEGRRRRSSPD